MQSQQETVPSAYLNSTHVPIRVGAHQVKTGHESAQDNAPIGHSVGVGLYINAPTHDTVLWVGGGDTQVLPCARSMRQEEGREGAFE